MDILHVKKTEDGKAYIGYYLGKEISKKSTLSRVMKALASYVKGLS